MTTVTGLTADRMIEMENATIIDGAVVGTDLILTTKDGTPINAGSVIGPTGPAGPTFVVCTSTTRPTYVLADQGKAIYETDTKLVRIWTGTRFRLQERIVCTSTTRPAMTAGDEGVCIYETDTDLEFNWDGTSWISAYLYVPTFANAAARDAAITSPREGMMCYLSDIDALQCWRTTTLWNMPWKQPWGHLASYGNNSNMQSPSGGGAIPGVSLTVTLPPGRLIKATFFYAGSFNDTSMYIWMDNHLPSFYTNCFGGQINLSGNNDAYGPCMAIFHNVVGTHTFKVALSTGSATVYGSIFFILEDMGPSPL